MRTRTIRGFLAAALLALPLISIIGVGVASAETKIGVIDFQRVLRESVGGQAARAEIERQGESVEATLKKQRDDLERLKTRLEAEARVMSQDRREKEERDFRIKVGDFQALQAKKTREFKELEAQVIQRVQKEVFELVERIGRDNGFTMIVEKGLILYNDASIDVTDQLIALYNAKKR